MLAYYLHDVNDDGEHDFIFPMYADSILLDEGFWEKYVSSPQRQAKIDADAVSYVWDRLIEHFAKYIVEGTQYYTTTQDMNEMEFGLRLLARENRFSRRMLGGYLIDLIGKTGYPRFARVIPAQSKSDTTYVFMTLEQPINVDDDNYRAVRRQMLHDYCLVTKLIYPDSENIIGIATEPGNSPDMMRSEDLLCLEGKAWDEELETEARKIQSEQGLLTNPTMKQTHFDEYPVIDQKTSINQIPNRLISTGKLKGRDRNKPCPCGSGKKYKKCCGIN